jgi:hypothetical protein
MRGYPIVESIIEAPGQYRTRAGECVEVETLRGRWAYGAYPDGTRESWHRSGRILPSRVTGNDIVSEVRA